jgi:hypothetical protein
MGRPYNHQYLNADTSRCGTMLCSGCGKQIVDGQYRCYQRNKSYDWAYVTHHRNCCSDDPKWQWLDAQCELEKARSAEFLIAAVEFRDKWGVSDLDELIEELSLSSASEGRIAA